MKTLTTIILSGIDGRMSKDMGGEVGISIERKRKRNSKDSENTKLPLKFIRTMGLE